MITNNDENQYIRGIIKAICKTNSFDAAIYGSFLYIVVEKTELYIINLEGRLLDNTRIIGFDNNSLDNPDYIVNSDCLNYVLEKVSKYTTIINNGNIIYSCANLLEDPLFNNIIHMKSVEGSKMYFMDNINTNYPLSAFAGLFNLNKDDTISADIIKDNTGSVVTLYYFHIFKKKINLNYNMIIRGLDINQLI